MNIMQQMIIRSQKGEYIERILIKKQIDKSNAIMIGDSYKWDYKSATDIGVDAVLIESKYEDEATEANHRVQSIVETRRLFCVDNYREPYYRDCSKYYVVKITVE